MTSHKYLTINVTTRITWPVGSSNRGCWIVLKLVYRFIEEPASFLRSFPKFKAKVVWILDCPAGAFAQHTRRRVERSGTSWYTG